MRFLHRLEAYGDLLCRFRELFLHSWKERKSLEKGIFNEAEAEFLPSVLSLQERPVSPASRLTAKILMMLAVIATAWSVFGRVDIIVNAAGKVIPNGRSKILASVDVASVRAIHVEEGQAVKAHEVLVELDATASDAERDKAAGEATASVLQMARAQALIAAVKAMKPPRLPKVDGVEEEKRKASQAQLEAQYLDFRTKLDRIDGEIIRYKRDLPLARQREEDYKALSISRDVSIHAYLEKKQTLIDLEGQLADAKNQRSELLAETERTAYDTLTEAGKAAAASRKDALRANSRSRQLKLRSPVDGTVQQLAVHTVGGVVPAAQPLMMIVPKNDFAEVEAFIENKDIGFIREGQEAEVKVDAFDYTKYGTVPAKVIHVSRDAIEDEKRGLVYSVKVALGKSVLSVEGKDMPLGAGMSVEVEIRTGTRRIIEYVLSPLLQHEREALHER